MNMMLKTKDGFDLFAEYNKVSNNKAVVFAHGITSDIQKEKVNYLASQDLNSIGISTLLIELRAHGRSTGDSIKDFTITGGLTDIQTAIQFLENEKYKEIELLGASFGGGLAAIFVGEHTNSINRLFLTNPAIDYESTFIKPLTEYAKKQYGDFQDKLDEQGYVEVGSRKFRIGVTLYNEMRKYKPYEYLSNFENPLMIVQGTKDKYIDHKHTKKIFDTLSIKEKKFILLKGAEHGFHTEPYQSQVRECIVNFFSK